jgi:hypothetical protein
MSFFMDFSFAAEPKGTVARIVEEARKVGVQIDGDYQQGTFSGHQARGSYAVNGHRLTITVTEKPWIFPEALIRKVAREKAPEWGLEPAYKPQASFDPQP